MHLPLIVKRVFESPLSQTQTEAVENIGRFSGLTSTKQLNELRIRAARFSDVTVPEVVEVVRSQGAGGTLTANLLETRNSFVPESADFAACLRENNPLFTEGPGLEDPSRAFDRCRTRFHAPLSEEPPVLGIRQRTGFAAVAQQIDPVVRVVVPTALAIVTATLVGSLGTAALAGAAEDPTPVPQAQVAIIEPVAQRAGPNPVLVVGGLGLAGILLLLFLGG